MSKLPSLTNYYYVKKPKSPVVLAKVGQSFIKKTQYTTAIKLADILGYSLVSRISLPAYQYRKYPKIKLNGKSYALLQQGNHIPTLSRQINGKLLNYKLLLDSSDSKLKKFAHELDALVKKYHNPNNKKSVLTTFLIEIVKYKMGAESAGGSGDSPS